MLKIYVARHGQDEDNAEGILNGRRDWSLTNIGQAQARDMATRMKEAGMRFDYIYTSPLERAHRTARIIAEVIGSPAPIIDDELIERDFGVMTGKPIESIRALCSPDIIETDIITYFLNPDGAETFPVLRARALRVLRWLQRYYSNESILLVTHGDVGKMLFAAYYGLDWLDVLKQFHFGNSEVLELSKTSDPDHPHVFTVKHHNH